MQFTEHSLELSIMELFENEEYIHQRGRDIHREKSEVLLPFLLETYLLHRYAKDFLTKGEIASIIARIKNISGSDYEANKQALDLICNGFTLRREDAGNEESLRNQENTKKDLFIQLIDFDRPERNYFEIVNQVEIQG